MYYISNTENCLGEKTVNCGRCRILYKNCTEFEREGLLSWVDFLVGTYAILNCLWEKTVNCGWFYLGCYMEHGAFLWVGRLACWNCTALHWNIFVQIAKYICSNFKMYLSKLCYMEQGAFLWVGRLLAETAERCIETGRAHLLLGRHHRLLSHGPWQRLEPTLLLLLLQSKWINFVISMFSSSTISNRVCCIADLVTESVTQRSQLVS